VSRNYAQLLDVHVHSNQLGDNNKFTLHYEHLTNQDLLYYPITYKKLRYVFGEL